MMLIALRASSQNDITKDSVVISKDVARKVLIDLLDYDRLRENKVEANLDKCIELQKQKDTLISYLSSQNKLFMETQSATEKQLKIREDQLVIAKRGNRKGLLYGAAGFAVGLALALLLAQ